MFKKVNLDITTLCNVLKITIHFDIFKDDI